MAFLVLRLKIVMCLVKIRLYDTMAFLHFELSTLAVTCSSSPGYTTSEFKVARTLQEPFFSKVDLGWSTYSIDWFLRGQKRTGIMMQIGIMVCKLLTKNDLVPSTLAVRV